MLSKSGTLILGLIAENPINPYEITKLTDYVSVKNWLSLPAPSVYSTIKTLHSKGYIDGQNVKDGNMPEKTIYTITESGKEQFIHSLEAFLGNTDWDFAKFNIAAIMVCHLPKDRAVEILKNKLVEMEAKQANLLQSIHEIKSTNQPATGIHAIQHMIYLTAADIASTKEFLDVIQRDKEWNHFLAMDIRVSNAKGTEAEL